MRIGRLGKVLTPESGIGIVVESEGQFTGSEVAVTDDGCSLVGIEMEDALGGDATVVAPERVGAILSALHDARVPEASHLHAAVSAEPSGDDGTLATTTHVAHVVAIGDACGRSAVHHHADDGTHVVARAIDIALVSNVLKGYPSAAIRAANDATHLVGTTDLVARTRNEVLDHAPTVDDAEDADTLLGRLILEVVDGVELSVEGAFVAVVAIAYRRPGHPIHVDVGREHGIGTILTTIHDSSKLDEVGGAGNLIDAVHLVECERTCAREPSYGHCQHRFEIQFHYSYCLIG